MNYVVDLIQNLNMYDDHINTWKNGVARALKKDMYQMEQLRQIKNVMNAVTRKAWFIQKAAYSVWVVVILNADDAKT